MNTPKIDLSSVHGAVDCEWKSEDGCWALLSSFLSFFHHSPPSLLAETNPPFILSWTKDPGVSAHKA